MAVTCEADGSIHLWDLELRHMARTLGGVGHVAADHLTLGLDDSMLVVCTGQSLQVAIFFSSLSASSLLDFSLLGGRI